MNIELNSLKGSVLWQFQNFSEELSSYLLLMATELQSHAWILSAAGAQWKKCWTVIDSLCKLSDRCSLSLQMTSLIISKGTMREADS